MPSTITGTFQGNAQAYQSSLASEPYLVLAALVVIYIILGVLYESYVHPLTILSTLPSAGLGALLMLWGFGFDFTVIALIGIVLLIGIVKKNGIMIVDFAIAAEREQGIGAARRDPASLSLALSPDHDDDDGRYPGGHPPHARSRDGFGAPAAAWLRGSWRASAEPGDDTLHNPRRLPVPRQAQHLVFEAKATAGSKPCRVKRLRARLPIAPLPARFDRKSGLPDSDGRKKISPVVRKVTKF